MLPAPGGRHDRIRVTSEANSSAKRTGVDLAVVLRGEGAGGGGCGNGGQSQHADRGPVQRGRGVGLHANGRGLGGVGDRGDRRRGQGRRAGLLRAGARDLCADGGGRRRPAEAAGIRAALALGTGGVLVGRRCRPAGNCGLADAAKYGEAGLDILRRMNERPR